MAQRLTSLLAVLLLFNAGALIAQKGKKDKGGKAPEAPSNLTATAEQYQCPSSGCRISLAWKDNSRKEEGFRIERADAAQDPWSDKGTVSADVTSFTDGELQGGKTYYYRVVAFASAADSPFSNVAADTTAGQFRGPSLTIPPGVTEIRVELAGGGGGGGGGGSCNASPLEPHKLQAGSQGGGGGGSGESVIQTLTVQPGQRISLGRGPGGVGGRRGANGDSGGNGQNGGPSTVRDDSGTVTLSAKGGGGGRGGASCSEVASNRLAGQGGNGDGSGSDGATCQEGGARGGSAGQGQNTSGGDGGQGICQTQGDGADGATGSPGQAEIKW